MRGILAAIALIFLPACFSGPPMAPASPRELGPVAPDRARVVFFRPSWEADPPPFARHPLSSTQAALAGTILVDERAHAIGTVRPGTFVVAEMEPGEHAFFAQDVQDLDFGCVTDCLGIGVAPAHLLAGKTYGILVEHPNRFVIGQTGEQHRLDLLRADGVPLGSSARSWLRLDSGAQGWADAHVDRLKAIVQGGTERLASPRDWDPRQSVVGP